MAATCKEGKLSKYTNVMKGWQNRYFILNPATGVLEYHINQAEVANYQNKPRGFLQLEGAVIAPSIEDSCTFTVNASNGEVFKLRAINAKERQDWVAKLRSVGEYVTTQVAEDHPPLANIRKTRTKSLVSNFNKFKDQVQQLNGPPSSSSSHSKLSSNCSVTKEVRGRAGSHSSLRTPEISNICNPNEKSELKESFEAITSADNYLAGLNSQLENLPLTIDHRSGTPPHHPESEPQPPPPPATITCVDKDVMLIKCTASAILQSLTAAHSELLHVKQQADAVFPNPGMQVAWNNKKSKESITSKSATSADAVSLSKSQASINESKCIEGDVTDESSTAAAVVAAVAVPIGHPDGEVMDEAKSNEDADEGGLQENKNVVLQLISKLKLGMDLTKVTLPTFILETRSLLEMYADFNSCTRLLLDVAVSGETPLQRMNKLLKFYLVSFYTGRRGGVMNSKKPYNPAVGEVFQCSFLVNKSKTAATEVTVNSPLSKDHHHVRFIAEQVSHHPPVSAMHLACDDLNMSMTSHIWTKSKFMNMSVGVSNIGEATLTLGAFKENYDITYPSAYARSLLTEPWSELTGRCTIDCAKSGLVSNVVFHTKPSYGGEPHKVSAEIKKKDGTILTKVSGKWNGELKFTYMQENGEHQCETLDVTKVEQFPKFVRPIEKQDDMESRRFWLPVTDALNRRDYQLATERKSKIEERQRDDVKRRVLDDVVVNSAYFTAVKKNSQENRYLYKG